ncbi:hypothetical protein TWF730_005960 [Orbilia blumenaviensis]|uniref:Protein kinase domain-containing protein n=1 Tax=Orbilia blumenaviensis TaxID=1796055 RepID=A0AAV9VM53_9PEZI
MAEIAGLVIGLPGLAEVCFKLCGVIQARVKDYGNSVQLTEMNKTIVRLLVGEIHTLLEYFASRAETLPPGLSAEIEELYQILRSLLEKANRAIPQNTGGKLNSLKFALFNKQKIDEAVKELEEWQSRFMRRALIAFFFNNNPGNTQTNSASPENIGLLGSSGYQGGAEGDTQAVIERIRVSRTRYKVNISESELPSASNKITESIQASTSQGPKNIILIRDPLCVSNTMPRVPNSPVAVAAYQSSDDTRSTPILVDFRPYPENATEVAVQKLRKLVRDVAAVFASADPEDMSVLTCIGFAHDPLNSRFELHFNFPSITKDRPRSLSDMLLDSVNKKQGVFHHLNQRVMFAKQLASAILYVHSFGFVHKNIRPDNVLVFEPSQATDGSDAKHEKFPRYLGKPFLVGFNGIRKVDAESQMLLHTDPKQMIYHHPDRYRLKEGDEFTMKHDVYSLGVIMLEIALWNSFYDRGPGGLGSKLWADANRLHPPDKLNSIFVRMATTQVPRIVGERYRDAVLACLTGLKDENGETITKDEDGVELGLAYLQQVVEQLEEISL